MRGQKIQLTETGLLLSCVRAFFDAQSDEALRASISEGVNWPLLLDMADKHGLIPILYLTVSRCASDLIPEAVLKGLEQSLHENTRRCLHLTGRLLKLLDLFETHSIEALALKGPALADSAYGSLALRQFSDLDILIHARDLLKVKEILASERYVPQAELTEAQYVALQRYNCEILFSSADGNIFLDMHWGLLPPQFNFTVTADELWHERRRTASDNASLPVLSPEDTILFLCAHGAKHLWRRLEWVCSIGGFIRNLQAQIDWQSLFKKARDASAERRLLLGLLLVEKFLGIKLPDEVQTEWAAKGSVAVAVDEVLAEFLTGQTGEPSQKEIFIFNLKVMDGAKDALLCLWRSIFVPTLPDLLVIRLPATLLPLYYVARACRLAGKYFCKAAALFSHRSTEAELEASIPS
ncbi:MAG: hypothetical protein AUG51_10275 [Acidobacteria bacterium 13_1_20CM_3_53_8]|nr:MAG: hypothetical protein AUG51_10275 [Acidobacteria bacterium 13_1_20CM_3_53_8]